jgi:hypothetical protein
MLLVGQRPPIKEPAPDSSGFPNRNVPKAGRMNYEPGYLALIVR